MVQSVNMSNEKPILPPFTRWQWAGKKEREKWHPLLQQIKETVPLLERLSVAEGVRRAAVLRFPYNALPPMTKWAQSANVVFVPRHMTPFDITGVFVRIEDYAEVATIDEQELRRWTGCPDCCSSTYDVRKERGLLDFIPEQEMERSSWLTNNFLHAVGVHLVPHYVCHAQCSKSEKLAKELYDVGLKYGFETPLKALREMLNWPVKWTRRFGIAEITTPALRIITNTDWTPNLQEIQRPGSLIRNGIIQLNNSV